MKKFNLSLDYMIKLIKIDAIKNPHQIHNIDLLLLILEIEQLKEKITLSDKHLKIIEKEIFQRNKNSQLLLKFDQYTESNKELVKALTFVVKVYKECYTDYKVKNK